MMSRLFEGRTGHGRVGGRLLALFGGAAALVGALLFAAPEARSNAAVEGAHLGVASCAGSTCHGRMAGDGPVVRQDEIARWQEPSTQGGAHSRAFAVLSNARSQTIARNLDIDDATTSTRCIGCHSSASRSEGGTFRYQQTDGVNCETCHGSAGGWISSHYAGLLDGPTQHRDNVRRGLRELEDPSVRANTCLNCHFGSKESGQFVTHEVMAAGHPRISFELDLFSTLQAHHNEDADYLSRKGGTDHVQLWAVGQALALQRSLDLFRDDEFGSRGVFPEFYFYDCHSCHRQIVDSDRAVRNGMTNRGRPILSGMPPYNDENMIMLSAAVRVGAPAALAARFEDKVRAFHGAMARGRPMAQAAARDLNATLGELVAAFEGDAFGPGSAQRMVREIAGEAIRERFTDYEGSVQAVMGVDTLLGAMVSSGEATVGSAAAIRSDINRAYAAVRDPNAYRPREFQTALASAVRRIGALQ